MKIDSSLVENQSVVAGDRFGLIRFGSRVDIYLPQSYTIKVLEGQTVISGETIIGEIVSSNQKVLFKVRNPFFLIIMVLNHTNSY